jgi:predicted acyltransferase
MEKSQRLLSLDVFRGMTIVLMIIVNNPGSWAFVYPPLSHSKWNGCTPTDLVFPFFMFIMGTAMYYSFKKFNFSLNRNSIFKILKRSLIIFLLGLFIHAFPFIHPDLGHLRIMGVLERIAIAYCIASFIILGFNIIWIRIITVVILIGYWIMLAALGGNDPYSLNGNFVRVFDVFILGANHMPLENGVVFDLTGLFSTLPSIATVLLGFFTGRFIATTDNLMKAVTRILIAGILLILAAIAWNQVFPINKDLWTSSFVLYTAGWAMVVLSILFWIIDIKGIKKWTHPLLCFGLNPLFIYVLSCLWSIILVTIVVNDQMHKTVTLKQWMYYYIFSPVGGNMIGSLLYAIHLGILFWLIAWFLERKKIFIKI